MWAIFLVSRKVLLPFVPNYLWMAQIALLAAMICLIVKNGTYFTDKVSRPH